MDVPSPSPTKSVGWPSPNHDKKNDGLKPLEALYLMCSSVARLAWQKHIRFGLFGTEYDVTKTNITRFCLWKGNFNAGQLDTILLQLDELKILVEENLVSIGNSFLIIVSQWIFVCPVAREESSNSVAALTGLLSDAHSLLAREDTTKDLRARTIGHTAISYLYEQLNSSFEQLMSLTPAFERELQFLEYCRGLGIPSQPENRDELVSDIDTNTARMNPPTSQHTEGSQEKLPVNTKHTRNPVLQFVRGYIDHGGHSGRSAKRTVFPELPLKSNRLMPEPPVDQPSTDSGSEAGSLCPGRSHRRSGNHAQYFCPECGNRFTKGADLKRHLETTNPSKMWKCPKCDDRMSRKDKMMQHLKVVHRGHLSGDVPVQTEMLQRFPERCKICSKPQFSWKEWVEHHISIHCKEEEIEEDKDKEQEKQAIPNLAQDLLFEDAPVPALVHADFNREHKEHNKPVIEPKVLQSSTEAEPRAQQPITREKQ